MTQPNGGQGILPHAQRWSMIGVFTGLGALLALVVAHAAYRAGRPDGQFLEPPFGSLANVAIAMTVLGSLIIYVGCRLMRKQRRIAADLAARLEAIESKLGLAAGTEPTGGGNVFPLPSPETVAAVRRLAGHVTGAA